MKPRFHPGRSIAMKVPAHEYERTVALYGGVLGFEPLPADFRAFWISNPANIIHLVSTPGE